MYIEQKFYDNGKAYARLMKEAPIEETINDAYDSYIDEVDDMQEWIEDNLEIDLDDIVSLVLDLDSGKWVDITNYC